MTRVENTRRGPYACEEMRRLVAPESVAVVGVSERANAFGSRTVANLKAFDGRLYQINAKHAELAGRPCYPTIAALPETVVAVSVSCTTAAGLISRVQTISSGCPPPLRT